MRAVIGRVVLAAALLIAGGLVWMAGRLEGRVADGARRLASLHRDPAAGAEDGWMRFASRVPWVASRLSEAAWQRVASEYFLGDPVAPPTLPVDAASSNDARVQLLTGNLEFHRARRLRADRQTLVQALDGAIRRYTDVVKNSPGREDAAYNLELALRTRLALARRARTGAGPETIDQPPDGQPAKPSVHGTPGDAPPQVQMKPFNVITPQQPEERKQLDAGQGPKPVRKG